MKSRPRRREVKEFSEDAAIEKLFHSHAKSEEREDEEMEEK